MMAHRTLGLLITFWGLLVMWAWYQDIHAIITIPPSAAAMQFNTALCFVGLGLYKIFHVRLPLVGVLLIALPTILQDITGITFGIDTLFFSGELVEECAKLGRMSSATSLFFLLCSASGLMYYIRPDITRLVFSFVGAFSLFFMALYSPTLQQYVGEAIKETSISLPTAILFFLFTSTSLHRQIQESLPSKV